MNGFEEYGKAMMLAHEGNTQLAAELAAGFKRLVQKTRDWLRAMPTTLPPTESFPPK